MMQKEVKDNEKNDAAFLKKKIDILPDFRYSTKEFAKYLCLFVLYKFWRNE